jgi:hypothetical protein
MALARLSEGKPQDATVLDILLNRNLRPTGFTPVVTDELGKEVTEMMAKHPSVKRALLGPPYAKK